MSREKIIEIRGVYKSYYNNFIPVEVLKDVSLTVYKGEIVLIVGESGCGKSTLLNLLGGLDNLSSGDIVIRGENIHSMDEDMLSSFRAKSVGFVFQFHHLLPDFTAIENVMLPYLGLSFKRKEAREKALSLLERMGLKDRLNHRPSELSGGEQQRVAIARALVNNPSIIFADEPTGNLDERNSEEIQELLWSLQYENNLTILIVSHNIRIFSMSDRILNLAYGSITEKLRFLHF